MVKITNTGYQPRGLPVTSRNTLIEIERGASVEMTASDWAAIKNRVSISALLSEEALSVEGDEGAPVSADAPPRAKRGRKPKAAASEGSIDDGDTENEGA